MNAAKLSKKNWQPYTLDYYNPKGFYYSSSSWLESATSRILNKLIDALNKNDRLPKYILIFPDMDIIADLKKFDFGTANILANITNWLMRQCDVLVRRKKLQITERKPGAIIDNHPTLIYVKMIRQPERYPQGSKLANICKLRTKFNDILNEGARKEGHKIISLKSCYTMDDFDHSGNLTSRAKSAIWHEIDDIIDRYKDPTQVNFTLSPCQASYK